MLFAQSTSGPCLLLPNGAMAVSAGAHQTLLLAFACYVSVHITTMHPVCFGLVKITSTVSLLQLSAAFH